MIFGPYDPTSEEKKEGIKRLIIRQKNDYRISTYEQLYHPHGHATIQDATLNSPEATNLQRPPSKTTFKDKAIHAVNLLFLGLVLKKRE